MSSKTLSIIILILLLIIGGFFLSAFFISRVEDKPFGEVLREVTPFGDIIGDIVIPGSAPRGGGAGGVTSPDPAISGMELPRLYKISAEPVSGAVSFTRNGTEYVRYALLDSGHVYEYGATTTIKNRLTNTTTLGVKEMLWGKGGEMVLIRYLDEENTIKTFLGKVLVAGERSDPGESSGIIYGDFLADDMKGMAASPDGERFFYLLSAGKSVVGLISGFNEKKEERVFSFPFSEWLVSWPQNDTLVVTTKPSAYTDGFAYTLNTRTKELKKLLGGVRGLTTRPSPGLANVLYSRGLENRVDTFLFDVKNNTTKSFPVSTLSEKCVWGRKEPVSLYCGVPERTPQGYFPDDWYQGKVSFSDALWKINTETNIPERISVPKDEGGEEVDAIELFLDTNENFLFFINKKDSSLWSLRLGDRG